MSARLVGRLTRVAGAVVEAALEAPVALGEVALVGEARLLGEILALDGAKAVAQVYEETAGLGPGEPLLATGAPLEVELGPGLLGNVFDGIQRPLGRLADTLGDFLSPGARAPALDRRRQWPFAPRARIGDELAPGEVLGAVQETGALEHRILVPPRLRGRVSWMAPKGSLRVTDAAARLRTLDGRELEVPLFQTWRVRSPRPFAELLPAAVPMITGQRVLDTFFPLPLGGSAGLPGGFGTGKTVLQQQLCKWADADVIVYVGCGERGNEMTSMLRELPGLFDPRTGRSLLERTVLIANTSNMPVSARESSVYTGVTIAEHYRDMGYRVALLADSISRWAEALREISGRMGEVPAEEGYPPSLSSRLAAFYERAGRVRTLGGREGSVTIISAISPPGGDLTEPVTRYTQSFVRTFWALDRELASARFFPAIGVAGSYGEVPAALEEFWEREAGPGWAELRRRALALLGEARRLSATARLIGTESLPERQRFVLAAASLLEDGFLQQSSLDPREARESPARQLALLKLLLAFAERGARAIDRGVSERAAIELPLVDKLRRARVDAEGEAALEALAREIDHAFDALEAQLKEAA